MFCIQTDTRHIEQVRNSIRDNVLVDGEEVFMPVTERMRKIDGRWQRVLVPMFFGYLFITSDHPAELYVRLHSMLGKTIFKYVKLIRDDEYIIPLSKEDERIVTELSDENHIIKASMGYIKGDRLYVTDGPLHGHEGEVVRIDRHKRIAILAMNFLGEKRNITIGLEVVRKEK
ncbi:MAG: antiterminator LoaP [Lachnospiraceae bacterium]|nr:antiterminator LoaP [Lachnospiraceae bacterium]